MLQSENSMSSAPLWSIDRQMTRQSSHPSEPSSPSPPLWDATPIGKSLNLRLCQREQLSPQLILEDKVFRSAIRLQHGSTYRSQMQFVGTLIVDDESQRLTYVIDRLQLTDSPLHEHPLSPNKQLNGEFLIPIRCDQKTGSTGNGNSSLMQEGIKRIDAYCRSAMPIELHQFSSLHGQMVSRLSPSINADLSFDLLTIKNSFKLTPIHSESVQMFPTALLNHLSSATGNSVYINQPHFGYCGLDRLSKNKILLILDNDPQACALPLVGIWVSGVADVQCSFVWAACLRYCTNASLKQRLRTGTNSDPMSQQSFLLACYLSTSRGQCDFYEVRSMTGVGANSPFMLDFDLWTCSKKIIMPNPPTGHQHDTSASAQLPYDFEFKHVYDGPKMYALLGAHTGNLSVPPQQQFVRPTMTSQLPTDISFLSVEIPSDDEDEEYRADFEQQQHQHQVTLSSPNTNGSLFGVPRLPPKQSTHQSPSWDSVSSTAMTTPRWIKSVPAAPTTTTTASAPAPPPPIRFSSPAPSTISPSTIATDAQWKEEMLEKMQDYNAQIQSLNALVAQLLAQQQHQNSLSSSVRESVKCDVAVQSEPPSPCTSDDVGESASMVRSNRTSPPSPKPETHPHYQQQQTPSITATAKSSMVSGQFQSSRPARQPEPVIDYASLRNSADSERLLVENTPAVYHQTPVRSMSPAPAPLPPRPPADLNPVDILKPFFQYMATQQQKQQQQQQLEYHQEQQRPNSPLASASSSFDGALVRRLDDENGCQAEKVSQVTNVIQQSQQQQQVTSTTTTGISFIANGLQMQFFNQQSSITTVYPPASIAPVPSTPTTNAGSMHSSNQPSENDLSIEVRSLAMKYLEDDQLAVAIEYDRQSPTPPSTVRQSPQTFDKSMSFATQKYFEKYGIVSGNNRQQQYYMSSDENDVLISSSPPHQRMLLPLPPPSTPPIFTRPPAPHAPQAKILDLSQIRKLPKLL